MYKVMSLFSGMGGMDIGFAENVIVHKDSVEKIFIDKKVEPKGFVQLKSFPFQIVFQNDILPIAEKLLELNGWKHNFHLGDIRDILLDEKTVLPDCDIVIGGFPCQDFSHAGKRRGMTTDRGTLYTAFAEVVKRTKPKIFVAENVHGLLTMPGNPIEKIIADFSSLGYTVKYQLIKAEKMGVPQRRWRVIILGIKNKYKDHFEEKWNVIEETKSCTVRKYFDHLLEPTESLDPAQTMYSLAKKLEKGQGQTEVLLDGFAPTMRAEHHGNIEFRRLEGGNNDEEDKEERRLTVREAALLQTFPPNCILTLNRKSMVAYKTIGNAVPPLLAYHIANKVLKLMKKIDLLDSA